jgi:hypothetical protein
MATDRRHRHLVTVVDSPPNIAASNSAYRSPPAHESTPDGCRSRESPCRVAGALRRTFRSPKELASMRRPVWVTVSLAVFPHEFDGITLRSLAPPDAQRFERSVSICSMARSIALGEGEPRPLQTVLVMSGRSRRRLSRDKGRLQHESGRPSLRSEWLPSRAASFAHCWRYRERR